VDCISRLSVPEAQIESSEMRNSVASDPDTLLSFPSLYGQEKHFKRDVEIYREGSQSTDWYQVASGAVRVVTIFADGQRHISNFHLAGEFFGFEFGSTHRFAAEAVTDCILYRYPRRTTGQLIEELPQVAQQLWNLSLKELATAQSRSSILGRMTAPMRVAAFLLDFSTRYGEATLLDLPMSRVDLADYLGLTVETVCRVLSRLDNLGLITVPNPRQIEIIDIHALEMITLEGIDPALGYYGTRRTSDKALKVVRS
jgi:CRP/FNR family transcriptional regulator, nitrogen fixation regulation protein